MKSFSKSKHGKSLLCIPLIIVLIVAFAVFKYFNPSVGFTYYKPSYLPPGVSVKERRISMGKYASTQVEQNFRTVDWVYEIQESAADSTATIGTAQQNYNPASVKPTCDLLTSSYSQRYRLCHWIDYGRIDVHEVIFIKNGTYVISRIPSKLQQQITIPEIGMYVDSFKPASTLFMPVLRTDED